MPPVQASRRPTVAPFLGMAAVGLLALVVALAPAERAVAGQPKAGQRSAAGPASVEEQPDGAVEQTSAVEEGVAPPIPKSIAQAGGATDLPTVLNEADDGALYQPGEPQLQNDQPDWLGPACEEPPARQSAANFFNHLLPPSNGRYRPIGVPLLHESWLNRQFSFGLLTGGVFNANPINGHVDGTPGYLFGFRVGWDVDYFWGVEGRVAYSVSGVEKPGQIGTLSNMQSLYWDTDVLWYPWGDTKWRPFLLAGLGLVDYRFVADTGFQVHQTTFEIPFGVGLKYRHNSRWTFRFDLLDNLTFASGGGINTMNNISITGTLEAHFGIGPKRSYWPWNPSRNF
ncbi:MAG TPA: outer membrane beta-barrel protein [Pirellulales bacterium]|jgi:hypothetical protein|nr:outer membrane beta-barrel protein [Pirellulales bacterium]